MYVLAHLSDPHLAPLPPAPAFSLLNKRLTGYLNWYWFAKRHRIHDPAVLERLIADLKSAGANHIAATGDFANIALPAEFEHARRWLENLGTPQEITAIPGNHDAYVRGAMPQMQRSCGTYMRGDDGSNEFPFVRRRGPLTLIGVSTAVPTALFQATGWLGDDQLARLGQLLGALKDSFRVVLIHHPPTSPRPRNKLLLDSPALLRTIATHGAELIIHGHDHVHALVWLDGPDRRVPAVGVPSASATPAFGKNPAAYNLYRIEGSAGAWRCEMESRGIGRDGSVGTLQRMALTDQGRV